MKILNFYMKKVITIYYILESIKKNNLFNEALNLMELGFGEYMESPGQKQTCHWIDDDTCDIENNKPLETLSLIHPDDCV
jgi:hypothetical protein